MRNWMIACFVVMGLAGSGALADDRWPDVDSGSGVNYTISTSQNATTVANSAPAGATITFAPGVHVLTGLITAKARQTYEGHGAILSGRRNLTHGVVTWVADTGDWRVDSIADTAYTVGPETCESGFTECERPNDLFFMTTPAGASSALGTRVVPKLRVVDKASVVAGTWFFDEATDKVYVGDDPITGSPVIYLSNIAQAINVPSGADGVTIKDLTLEFFATGETVGGALQVLSDGVVLDNVTARWNHSRGVSCGSQAADYFEVKNSNLSDNGGTGLTGCGNHFVAHNSLFNRNNYNGYSNGYASGGMKVGLANDVHIYANHFDGNLNDADGFWLDTAVSNFLVENNTMSYNAGRGMNIEVSCLGVVRNNVINYNRTQGIICDTCNLTDFYKNHVEGNGRVVTGGRQGGIDVWETEARIGTSIFAGSVCSDGASWSGLGGVTVRYNTIVWKPDEPNVAIDPINFAHTSNTETGDVDFIGNCYDASDPAVDPKPFWVGNHDASGTFTAYTFTEWQSGTPPATSFDNDADARYVTHSGDCENRLVTP